MAHKLNAYTVFTVVNRRSPVETSICELTNVKASPLHRALTSEKLTGFIQTICSLKLLLRRGRSLLAGAAMILHALFALGLHFIPFLLLRRVEKRTHLRVRIVADIHHLRPAVLLRKRRILVQVLHLRLFGRENLLHLGLLIGRQVEMFGQFLGPLGRILRAMVPFALALRGRGLLII